MTTVGDLGSTNGTTLNGERLEGIQPLHANDRLYLGEVLIQVVSAPES